MDNSKKKLTRAQQANLDRIAKGLPPLRSLEITYQEAHDMLDEAWGKKTPIPYWRNLDGSLAPKSDWEKNKKLRQEQMQNNG